MKDSPFYYLNKEGDITILQHNGHIQCSPAAHDYGFLLQPLAFFPLSLTVILR